MNKFLRIPICLFIVLFAMGNSVLAQRTFNDSTSGGYFSFKAGPELPIGTNKERFGLNTSISLSYDYKTNSNWAFGGFVTLILSNNVKEDSILKSIETNNGFMINSEGFYGDVRFFERGLYSGFQLSKTLNLTSSNRNSGIIIGTKFGYLQHKIRVQNLNGDVPQVSKAYKRGYDRLRGGPALSAFIGYQNIRSTGSLNWNISLETTLAQTYNLRTIQFDNVPQNSTQIDGFIGLKLGIILPFFKNKAEQFYY